MAMSQAIAIPMHTFTRNVSHSTNASTADEAHAWSREECRRLR